MTGILLPGHLPLDELLFFLVTPTCAILAFEAVRGCERPVGRGIGAAVSYTELAVLGWPSRSWSTPSCCGPGWSAAGCSGVAYAIVVVFQRSATGS